MKKKIVVILIFVMLVSLVACGKSTPDTNNDTSAAEKALESTVIAPTTVTFYKDGKKSVSTDKELNHKVAQHVESWFGDDSSGVCIVELVADTQLINEIKWKDMAIELQFDDEIKFHGGIIDKNTRTLFVVISGEHNYSVFHNTINDPDNWSGPFSAGDKQSTLTGEKGIEKFFEGREFENIISSQTPSQNEEIKQPPKTEETTSQVEKSNEPTEPVLKTENITRITFYGYYGYGKGVDVPAENMAEVIKWLGTFEYGEKVSEMPKPGTNTHCVEIEYIDGAVIKQGLDVIVISGINYKLQYGTCPECYWDLISKSTLPT